MHFEGVSVRTTADGLQIREALETAVTAIGRRVSAIVDHDNRSIAPEAEDASSSKIPCCATSAFLRSSPGRPCDSATCRRIVESVTREGAASTRPVTSTQSPVGGTAPLRSTIIR